MEGEGGREGEREGGGEGGKEGEKRCMEEERERAED